MCTKQVLSYKTFHNFLHNSKKILIIMKKNKPLLVQQLKDVKIIYILLVFGTRIIVKNSVFSL